MAKQPPHLRFLLSLEDTKMVVLSTQDKLHIYSNHHAQPTRRETFTSEHITEALVR